MLGFIGFALATASLLFGYTTARQFVRSRLKYVDGIHTWRAPILAGLAAAAIAFLPFSVIPLPFITTGTALLFGFSVGVGVRAGVKDVRGRAGYIEGP
jgi:hypothetical protein